MIVAAGGWFTSNEAVIQNTLVMVLLAFSLHVSLRAGIFSVAGVGFFGIGAYTAGYLVLEREWTTVPALAAATIPAAIIGFLLALVLGRLRRLYLTMATFAFVLLIGVVALEWKSVTGGPLGLLGIPPTVSTLGLLLTVLATAAAVILYESGKSGRMLEALRLDEQLAESMGVAVVRQRVVAFVFSSMLGGLAGGMHALLFNIVTPDLAGFKLIVDGLTMIVIGGTAAWYGPVIGAAVVVWLPEVLAFAGDWRLLAQGVIVVLIVIYAPEGSVGLIRRLRDLLAARNAPSSVSAAP